MTFTIINNPDPQKSSPVSGFRNFEYRQLASLFSRGASVKAFYDIAVDVDFDTGTATFTYYRSNAYRPYLQFIIQRVGPQNNLYELFKEGEGRIARSGQFDRTLERLTEEVTRLIETNAN